MKTQTKLILTSFLAILGLAFFVSAHAQQVLPKPLTPEQLKARLANPPQPQAPPAPIEGSVNCFDYYHFGSVQVDIESRTNLTVPGVPLMLTGKIKNANDYPVVDGQVYIKVFKKLTNDKDTQANGFQLVDQFTAKDDITLAANEEQDINFTWNIPNYATSGDYQIATFFTSAKKFNLLGLSFTNDVVGNTFNFAIKAQNQETVQFNKNTVKINDKDYHFATFPPKIEKDAEATTKVQLANATKQNQSIPVTWTLYSWDGQLQQNILDTKTETVELKPNETKDLTYTTTNSANPVSYLVAEADYKDTKSILDIRFVRNNVDKVRINFPAITHYPLQVNQPETLFTCLHNSGQSDQIENNQLKLTLLDENGNTIHTYNYTGAISGAMMGLKDEFTPNESYDTFTLKAELYHENQLVDSAEMKYDCNQIQGTTCQAKKANGVLTNLSSANQGQLSMKTLAVVVVIILLIASLIIFAVMHRKRGGMNLLLVGLVVSSALLFGNVGKGEAKSVQWNKTYVGTFGGGSGSGNWQGPYSTGVRNPSFAITYNAQVENTATGASLSENSVIPIGSRLLFEALPQMNTDFSWFGTGFSSDSPYGFWLKDGGDMLGTVWNKYSAEYYSCPKDVYGIVIFNNACYFSVMNKYYADIAKEFDITNFIKDDYTNGSMKFPDYGTNIIGDFEGGQLIFAAKNPVVTIGQSGTAGLSCDANGINCTVTSPGTIIATFNFANTNIGISDMYSYVSNFLPVPAQTITYNLTATAGNPPTAPIVTGPTTGYMTTDYTFTATSTDPDNDQLKYGFDWDNNGTVDQYMPGAGYVASGTAQSATHQWIANGSYTFQVLAEDLGGADSPWTSYTIGITTPANCPADCTSWSAFGNCSAACGQGTQTKTCTSANCLGFPITQTCNTGISCHDLNWREVSPN